MDKNRVIIFDTTLRDGEQAPGCSMNLKEKLAVAQNLARMGVDVIEAGFPVASPGDFEAVKAIADSVEGPVICGLARATKKDIDACMGALENAPRRRIHTFIATSPIHMAHKLRMSEDEVVQAAVEAIQYAKTFTDDVEFSCEDASRSEIPFLQRICTEAIRAGATTINLPDTVGYAMPWEYATFIRNVIDGIPNKEDVIFSVHCHDDLGMAVANSISALDAGARQIEVAVNGIGERAGNASLEEVVMSMVTKEIMMGYHCAIDTKEIYNVCRLVSQITGMPIPANKSVVGGNAFLHESGIHQDGVLKERSTYEIMNPEMIGIKQENLVLGKHSGRHAFQTRLKALGYEPEEAELNNFFESFKRLCDKKKEIHDEDLIAIVFDHAGSEEHYKYDHLHVFSGTDMTSTATLGVRVGNEMVELAALGHGPVDAAYAAVDKLVEREFNGTIELLEYRIDAMTPGHDAQGEVRVKMSYDGRTVHGKGYSTSILEASTKAYLNAMNKIMMIMQL